MTFGEKLLNLRKREGLSQEQLAEKLNVSRQAISRWELGSAMPDSLNLLQISKLFQVSADYLLHDEFESDRDIPVVKQTTDKLSQERNRQIALVVLIGLQAFACLITFISMFVVRMGIARIFGMSLSFLNIIAFEVSYQFFYNRSKGKEDTSLQQEPLTDARRYRRKYYQISVWLFSYFPLRWVVTALWGVYPRPYTSFMREGSILMLYFCICLVVTIVLSKRFQGKKLRIVVGGIVIGSLTLGIITMLLMREMGMTDVYTDVISTYIYRK